MALAFYVDGGGIHPPPPAVRTTNCTDHPIPTERGMKVSIALGILGGFIGFISALLGYGVDTKEYWLIVIPLISLITWNLA